MITSNVLFVFVICGSVQYFVGNVLHIPSDWFEFHSKWWFVVCLQIIAASSRWRCIDAHWNRSPGAFTIFERGKWIASRCNEMVFVARSNGFRVVFVGSTVCAYLKFKARKEWNLKVNLNPYTNCINTYYCPAARLKCVSSENTVKN